MDDAPMLLAAVKRRIAAAAEGCGRDAADVRLIAVSKTFEADRIEPYAEAGQSAFGENRVQEAQRKWPALRRRHPNLELHLVGPLQTNKTADAVALFDAIHSLDRDKLAGAVARECVRQGRRPLLFVQVNTGAEPQKSGVSPGDAEAFVRRCREMHGLGVAGLMCIPPADADPAPHFRLLRELSVALQLPFLSMGMSEDFETAIAHGATHVRIGSALFGARGSAQA